MQITYKIKEMFMNKQKYYFKFIVPKETTGETEFSQSHSYRSQAPLLF